MLDLQSPPTVQPASAQDWLATQEKLRGDYSTCAADFSMAQDLGAYTAAEHDLWRRLFRRQSEVAKRFAASAFLSGMKNLDMSADRIPDFEEASKRLRQLTGWEIVAVPGLIPDDAFFRHLAHRRFPVTVWIREEDEIDYLVEPDVFHDFFGHVPLLTQPIFADYLQEYGRKGDEAMAMGATKILARLFWYMVEFGLIQENGAIKAYGAGMLSSATETEFSVASPKPQRLKFDLARVMGTDFRIDAFQETYFVLDSYDELFAAMSRDFAPLYRQLLATPAIPVRAIRVGDTIVNIAGAVNHC
ncbi:phenylalanine 4-monooxygenase [Dongia sp.]|uniref:phenylalanine 4-monooxygenase n=1 Tax=Dongia sp. TaxID=1977262 RepID=UPI0035B4F8F5